VILIVGVLAIGIAAALLARTLAAAQSIDKKAQTIAGNAGKINVATNPVIDLNRTNELASSILSSAKPLQGLLNTVDATAGAIDSVAKSINGTAGTINGTAGTINGTATTINGTARDINTSVQTINGTAATINSTAKGIDNRAAAILDVAQRIDIDAANINDALARTVVIARNIKIDAGNILNQAINIEFTSRCIDAKLRLGLINPPSPAC
jgi:methyl-accepting chemotaxis protein